MKLSLVPVSPGSSSLVVQRAEALLGGAPVMTFQPDPSDPNTCCSIRLVKGRAGTWMGLVLDRAVFADRVRMGMRPRFVLYSDAATPVVCGEADVKLLGRIGPGHDLPAGLDAGTRARVQALLTQRVFGPQDLVVIEVRPTALQIDEGEGPVHGAVPRT